MATIEEGIASALAGDLDAVRAAVREDAALLRRRTQFGVGLVHAAHYAGHDGIVDWLLGAGLEMDIHLAAQLDMTERVEAMLRAAPSLANERTAAGGTVLHNAAYWCARDTAELLLRHGADARAVGTSGLMIAPLGSAVASANIPNPAQDEARVLSTVLLLLSYGAEANHRRSDGMTALHTAAWRGHLDVMRVLLIAGADPAIAAHKDGGPHSGETAEMSARSQGHEAGVALLQMYQRTAAV